MSDGLDLLVTGVGATTPVGLSAPSTCAALRAGIARIGEIPGYLVDSGEFDRVPVRGGRVPLEWFDGGPSEEEWPGHERFHAELPAPIEKRIEPGARRLIRIGLPAAREAWLDRGVPTPEPGMRGERIGVYVGVSEHDGDDAVRQIVAELGIRPSALVVEPQGRAAAFAALHRAAKDLLGDQVDAALVGGIDSHIRPEALVRLDERDVLRSGTRPEGIIPGEAAGFIVLERAGAATAQRNIACRVSSIALASEPTVGTDRPNQGKALSAVLRRIRERDPGLPERALAICDLNGDRARAMEWSLASIRVLGDLAGDQEIWHAADCIGDVGAGAGILALIWGGYALQQDLADSNAVLAWGASDGPLRAAVLLSRASRATSRSAHRSSQPAAALSEDATWA